MDRYTVNPVDPEDLNKKVCDTCRWFNPANTGAADGNTCRRHAPITEAGRHAHRMWPYVFESDWCGDWEKPND